MGVLLGSRFVFVSDLNGPFFFSVFAYLKGVFSVYNGHIICIRAYFLSISESPLVTFSLSVVSACTF